MELVLGDESMGGKVSQMSLPALFTANRTGDGNFSRYPTFGVGTNCDASHRMRLPDRD